MELIRIITEVARAGHIWVLVALTCAGCASSRMTDTKRAGVEQLLVSNAIDTSLNKIDFERMSGEANSPPNIGVTSQ